MESVYWVETSVIEWWGFSVKMVFSDVEYIYGNLTLHYAHVAISDKIN